MKFKFTLAFLLMLMCSFGLQLSAQDACDDLVFVNTLTSCDEDEGQTTLTTVIFGGSGNYVVSVNGEGASPTSGSISVVQNTAGSEVPVTILVTDDDTGCTAELDIVLEICSKLCDGQAGELTGVPPGGSYCSGQSVEVGATGISEITSTFAQTFILVSGDDIVSVDDDGNFGTLADGSYCIYQYNYVFNNAISSDEIGAYPGDYTSFTDFTDAVQLAPVCSDLGDADGNCTAIEVSSAALVVTASQPLCDDQTNMTSISFTISGGSDDYSFSTNGGDTYDPASSSTVSFEFAAGTSISFIALDNATGCTSNVLDYEFEDCVKDCDAIAGTVDGPTAFCEGDDVAGYSATGFANFPDSFEITYVAVDGDGIVVATDENGDFGALAGGTYCVHSIQYVIVAGNPVTIGITTLELENVECISLSDCLPIEVTAAPVADPMGPADSVCDGTDFTLSAGDGFDSYAWTGPDGFTSEDQNPTANAAGTYTLVVTMNGCSSAAVDVEVTGGGTLEFSIVEGPATICSGGSTTFTSSLDDSDFTYSWTTDGGTVDTPDESSTSYTMGMPGTYTVSLVVTDGSGCTADAATVEVTVVEATDVPDPDDITVCSGSTAELSGPAGYAAYSWDTGDDTESITVGAGTYVLTLTDDNGCTDDVTYTVVVGDDLDLPTPDPISICEGAETTISGPAGFDTYSWDTGEDTQDITVGAGTYVVTVADAAGCSDDVTYVVNDDLVIEIPTPEPVSICAGSTTTLSGPAGYDTYSWDSGEDTQDITAGAGTYVVTVTDANGCSGSATYVVTDDLTIDLTDPAPATICPGSTTAISGEAGFDTYSWDTGENTQEITVGAGTYVLTVTDANGCSASATYVVNEGTGLDLPEPEPTAICSGSSATLTAPSGYTYLWADGTTGQSITVSAAGNYTVNVSDGAGCSDDLTFAVSVLDTPNETQPAPVAICSGESAVLTAPAGYTFSWSNGSTEQAITVNQAGTYTATIANGSCTQALNYVVSVGNTPTEPQPASITICEAGGSATLTAPAGYTYLWYNGSSDISVTVAGSGSYDVVISNGSCTQTLTYTVGIGGINESQPAPVSICAGSSTTLSAPAGYTYAWSTGSNAQTITVSAAGTYAVTLSAGACSAVLNYTVNETQPTTLGVTGNATQACPGTAITFTASGATNYSWTSTGGTLNTTTGGTVSLTAGSTPGTYSVTVSSSDGCTTAGSATFNVLDGTVAPCAVAPGSIGGVVFDDANGNGVQDPGEPGIGGVVVTVTDSNGNTFTTVTNADGSYSFPGLDPGTYTVTVGAGPAGTTLTTSGSNTVTVVSGQNTNGGSFGFNDMADNSIGDTVFNDANNNGVQDPGEAGIGGATVTIFDANGNVIGSTVTNSNGNYTFPNLPDGTYTVSVSVPGGSTLTTAGSFTVTVSGGQNFVDADFGIYTAPPQPTCTANSGTLTLLSSAGGTICGNGAISVQATGFTPAGGDIGQMYILTNENDIIVATSQTNGAFSGIAPGSYTVYSFSYSISQNGNPAVGQDFFASYLSTMNCWDVSDGIPLSVAETLVPVTTIGTGPDGICNEDEASWDVTIFFPGAGPVSLTGAVNGNYGADQVVAFTVPENTTSVITVTDASGCTQNAYITVGTCTKTSVELVDFDGRAENAGNYIFWSTASEVESKIFRVESSTNGIDFTTLGTVNAAGNSNVLNSYDMLDNNAASGNTYYRLVEVDIYGTETVYNTISVYRESDVRTTITIAPVPVQNILNIQLTNENPIDAQLQVFDMSGKIVKVVSNVNTTSLTIDVVDLAAGTYFVVLTTATESTTTKFIKD